MTQSELIEILTAQLEAAKNEVAALKEEVAALTEEVAELQCNEVTNLEAYELLAHENAELKQRLQEE